MTDIELFKEVLNRTAKNTGITMEGPLVCYKSEPIFNTDGYNLGYNLHRLTNLMDKIGHFR